MKAALKAVVALFAIGAGIYTALVGADYATDAVEEMMSGGGEGKDTKAAA